MTIGEEIREDIRKTLRDARRTGNAVVPCTTLWDVVGKRRSVSDPYYGRYKLVLSELLRTASIRLHKDEDGRPRGFELLERRH
jgi:hypothetical protein